MEIHSIRLPLIGLALSLSACGATGGVTGGATGGTTTPTAVELAAAQTDELDRERRRVRELEAELGLSRAEAVGLRDEVAELREAEPQRSARIGPTVSPNATPAPEAERAREPEPTRSGRRPLLRLYGPSRRPAASTVGVLPMDGPDAPFLVQPPPVASIRLPVTAAAGDGAVPRIPSSPLTIMGAQPGLTAPAPVARATPRTTQPSLSDPAVRQYRAALAHLSSSRLNDALAGLEGFLRDHPAHPYADNAQYWRGEIHYTRRDYRRALSAFSSLIEHYPRGNKVPDALLRIGLCYERIGQGRRARRVFDRLRMQYPESVAARMASREEA